MSWTIYCHTHVESGRRYIGLTSKTMLARWNDHVYKAKSSKGGRWHFPNAIRKYGKDAFSHEVLTVCETLEEANAYEAYFIDLFRTRDPRFGFNLAEGGQHEPHPIRKNPWDNPEYRAKQVGCIARLHLPEVRAKVKASLNTPESKAKRTAISKEICARPEVLARISFVARRPMSSSQRAELAAFRTGKRHSAGTIDKIRLKSLGNKHALGKKLSATSKEKQRASLRRVMPLVSVKLRRYLTDDDGNVTHKVCTVHGVIPVAECLVYLGPRVLCRECVNTKKRARRKSA